jgi:sialic acid synthase SpsE
VNRTLVIAEPGCTAEGDYDTMVRLLYAAKDADCDVWKPQWTSNPERMCERRHIGPDHPKREYYLNAYSWLNWPVEWHADFSTRCKALGMKYACTVFLPEDAEVVAQHAEYVKVSSFEAGDEGLLESVGDAAVLHGGFVLVSTGMGREYAESEYPWFFELHCVSAYPAPIDVMNLAVLPKYSGLSDHSRELDMGMMAVCAGAQIIETHYRLYDCNPENPDYPVAFDPGELAMYVGKIRKAERALGSGVKQVQDCEREMVPYKVTP